MNQGKLTTSGREGSDEMVIVKGMLTAQLGSDGTVKTWLTAANGAELRPLLAKNLDTAEQDFVRTYGLTPEEAAAFRGRIEHEGSASVPAAL
ncbi:MAG: hypothetical protein ABSC05_37530 [Candidatus Solibacter sp.]|jgi:hypothetical protein